MFSRKKKFFVLSIALLFVSCLIFTGCGNSNTQQTPPANNNQTEYTKQQRHEQHQQHRQCYQQHR